MRINCLHCGHRFDLGDAYDDYDGPVRCNTCSGLLEIRTQDGSVRAMRFPSQPAAGPAPQPALVRDDHDHRESASEAA